MIQLVADGTWHGLEDYLHANVCKRAAISYIGPAAAELLDLTADDMIILDGSDAALLAGQVDPNTIRRWLKARVDVRTLPNLHAKMIHIEGSETYAIISSANASARSRDLLREAAVLTDDEGLCAQVAEQLDVWWVESDPIGEAWLKRAREIYRPPTHIQGQRRPGPRPRRLWVGIAVNDATPVPPKAAAGRENLEQRYGRGVVDSWLMNPGDERSVRPGDEVVLVQAGPLRRHPRSDSPARPPAIVARIVLDGSRPTALLVWPQVAEDSRERRTYEQVLAAVEQAGGKIDWDHPFPARSTHARAIRALWGQRAV
ncbi:phospholipase D-like domain-containing protein [Micromonospora haikouensis]|uniref:phospholipase D-like domain-containing protein n=1 Tax=Micromonospora haikouensis TaxID=686309 RepID=UPI0037B45F3F